STEVAFKDQANTFAENQTFSKNISAIGVSADTFSSLGGFDTWNHLVSGTSIGYSLTGELSGLDTFLRFHPSTSWDGKGNPGLHFVSYTGATPADGYTPVSKASLT